MLGIGGWGWQLGWQLVFEDMGIVLVGFSLKGEGGIVIGCSRLVEGVVKASQFDGLGDGSKHCLDATSFDFVSAAKITLLDLLNENL